ELSRGRFYKEDCNLTSIATARVLATLQQVEGMGLSEQNRQPGQGREWNRPAAQACLEPVHDASRGLSRVCPAISLQTLETEVRIFVYKTPVFRTQRKVFCQHVVGASAIEKCTFCLGISAGNKPGAVAGGMEDQAPTSGQRVRTEFTDVEWQFHHHIRSDAVDVRLDSAFPGT